MTLPTHLELECPTKIFSLNCSYTPSETQLKIMAVALSFLLIMAQRAPISSVIHSQRFKKFNNELQ